MKESTSTHKEGSFENVQACCAAPHPDLITDITGFEYFSSLSNSLRGELIRKNNLRSLNITFSKRNFDAGPFIAEIIKRNPNLRHLRVNSPLDYEDAQIIAATLNHPKTHLISLGLNLLEIGEDGAELIIQAIRKHSSLIRFEFFSSFDGCVARKTLLRLEKGLANTQGLMDCYEYGKGPGEFPTTKIKNSIARTRYFTLRNIIILMQAFIDKGETETPLKLLPREILLMILLAIHPKITHEVCQRLCPSFFFKPPQTNCRGLISDSSQISDDAKAILPAYQ